MRQAYRASLVAAGTALLAAGSAGAAFPGANGRIVFARGSVVETINPDGTGLTQVLANAANPAWSPDGKRLAFSRGCRIFVAAEDGSGERALTSGKQCDGGPAWSPTGDALVFTRRIARRGTARAVALYVMRDDGSVQRRLTQRALTGRRLKRVKNWAVDSDPAWSSAGVIAFARGTATVNDTIYVVGANASGLRRFIRPSARALSIEPSWAPDGRTLAFTKRFRRPAGLDQVFLAEADGTGERALSEAVAGSNSGPAWSPDGSFVCLDIGFSDLYSNVLVIVRRDGSLVRVLEGARGGDVPDWQPLPAA